MKMFRRLNQICTNLSNQPKMQICTTSNNHLSTKSKGNGSRRILDHFSKNGQISNLDLFPNEFKRRSRNMMPRIYIADDEAAQKVSSFISRFHNKNVPFFEINPGPCILSKTLLDKLNIRKLGLIERTENFTDIQMQFKEKHGSRVSLKFIKFGWQHNITNFILEHCRKRQWHEDIAYQLITCLRPGDMCRLITDVVEQRGIFCNGRVEIFAIMSPLEYMRLTAGPESTYWFYTQYSCIFQMLFDYELLTELPRSSFLPWRSSKPAYGGKVKYNNEIIYLIRMIPRANLFSIFDADDLLPLRFFVYQCFFKRTGHIIPILEKWIPGIGADLITMNFKRNSSVNKSSHSKSFKTSLLEHLPDTFDIFTQCGSLTSLQICALFQLIRESPMYEKSSFYQQCIDFYASKRKETPSN